MPNGPHSQLTASPEPTDKEVREMAHRAVIECREAKAKAYDLIATAHDLLRKVDDQLARR
jgi:hypothetical protein